ncbi:MAG: DUF2760 domain-containing protein [Planctomycetes bacterium]|nr:DUF2760 domain-containing protein [Planctomycetota bacterium]
MQPEIGYAIAGTAAAMALIYFVVRYLQVGGDFAKARKAGDIAQRYLSDAKFKEAVDLVLNPPPPPPPKPWPDPLLLLTLMQREGRLIDFLLEDVAGADNETLGAGVRTIHAGCQKVLKEHLDLEPVLKAEEKSVVTVPAGFDPSAIRLTGNVTGSPPFKGSLEHHGWRVSKIKINKPAEGQDAFVLQPAEVELA